MAGKLNVDVGRSISEFRAVLKYMDMRTKLFKLIFRGKGLEFDGFDNYTDSDDSSLINWKATTRANKTLINKYKEERDLKFLLVLDTGDDMMMGSQEKIKCEYAAELLVAFTDLILKSGDKAGVLLYGDKIKEYLPPKAGEKHFHHLVDLFSDSKNYGGPSHLRVALDFILYKMAHRVDIIIFVSDFIKFDNSLSHELSLISAISETIAIMIKDPLDTELPNVSGEFVVEDPRTAQRIVINPKIAGKRYKEYSLAKEKVVLDAFEKVGVDLLKLSTAKKFAIPVSEFLEGRLQNRGKI